MTRLRSRRRLTRKTFGIFLHRTPRSARSNLFWLKRKWRISLSDMKSNNNVELYEKQNLIKGKRSSVCTVKFRYIAINVPSGEKKTLFDYFSEIKDDVDFMIHCSLHDDLIFFQRGAIRGGSVSTEGKLFAQNVILRSCAHIWQIFFLSQFTQRDPNTRRT